MKYRKNTVRKITGLLLLTVFALSACGNDQEPAPSPILPSAQSVPEQVEQPKETTDSTVQETAPEVSDDSGQPESVMDVICAASGIMTAKDGSLLVTDTYNKVVWQVQTKSGESTVYAGGETVSDLYGEPVGGYNDANLQESYFQCPWAIAPFLDGWAVSDADNNAIRLISEDRVQTVNGSTKEKLKIRNLGVVFERPTGLAADTDGNLYVSDTQNGAVRKITSDGKVTTVADKLEDPTGLCWKSGVLYVAETGANRIVKLEKGKKEVVAGNGDNGYEDGTAKKAAFSYPQGVAVGDDGAVYVADTGNSAVRMVKDGEVTTLLARDRTGLEMSPISPVGMLVDGKQLYICDNFSRKVLRYQIQ